jgi:hypothetical protein
MTTDTTSPLLQTVLKLTPLASVCCPVTKELYGYCRPVTDVEKTFSNFLYAFEKYQTKLGHKYPYTLPSIQMQNEAKDYFRSL